MHLKVFTLAQFNTEKWILINNNNNNKRIVIIHCYKQIFIFVLILNFINTFSEVLLYINVNYGFVVLLHKTTITFYTHVNFLSKAEEILLNFLQNEI